MLLSHIDYLKTTNSNYDYLFQIYETLLQKWIEREILSDDVLYSFTNRLALLLFRENRLSKQNVEFEEICKNLDLGLKPIEAKSRSLLNRNADGFYKFSHKSIYEYVLSKIAFTDMNFRKEFVIKKYNGLDMAKLFFEEMCNNYLKNKTIKVLTYMQFSEVEISKHNFTRCNLEYCRFYNCSLKYCRFDYTYSSHIEFINCNLDNISFNNAHLQYSIFSGSHLKNCTFRNCNLQNSNFKNGTEKVTKIEGETDFTNAKLLDADFSGVNLKDVAGIVLADFNGINFSGSHLINIEFPRFKKLCKVSLEGATIHNCKMDCLRFDNCNLANLKLMNTTFNGSDFIDCMMNNGNFTNAEFIDITMSKVEFNYSKFANCRFRKFDLKHVDFLQCKFKNCVLENSNFKNINIQFTEFSECDIDKPTQSFLEQIG